MLDLVRTLDVRFEPYHRHFPPGRADHDWIVEVTRRGWVILSLDRAIRYNPAAKRAIARTGARVFFLTGAEMKAEKIAEVIRTGLPRMLAVVMSTPAPFFATINRSGGLGVVKSGADLA